MNARFGIVAALAFASLGSSPGTPPTSIASSEKSEAYARASELVARVNAVDPTCVKCGTYQRCASGSEHDIASSGGGINVQDGEQHGCYTGSCASHQHLDCEPDLVADLGEAWLEKLTAAFEDLPVRAAQVLIEQHPGRVVVGKDGDYIQVTGCNSQVIAHVQLQRH
jgi:hypothetical protein